jgi:hypothetical protein
MGSTLLLEPFEAVSTGSIHGQNDWVLDSGTATVQTNEVNGGVQSLEIQNGSVSHALASDQSSIWTRFQVFLTEAPETDPTVTAANTSVAFFVNTNLTLTVYSNTTPVELSAPVATNVWTRFDVFCDYEAMTWNLSMNGTTVAAGLPLYSDNQQIEEVLIANNSAASVFVDDINILDEELTSDSPDADTDSIPDWWEQKYFGSITGCLPSDGTANGSLTCLETYIAGLSPLQDEPFLATASGIHGLTWAAKPGRVYDVLWTTNLLSGFTEIASGLTESEFFDTSSNTNMPSGFYKLQVGIE